MRDLKGQKMSAFSGRDSPVYLQIIFVVIALLLVAFLLGACQPPATEAPTEPPPTEVPPTEVPTEVPPTPTEEPPTATPLPDQSEEQAAWEASPHGNTYGLGKGPNTYCSRCHSPQNWDPTSTVDKPPNCVTCKFASEDEIRMASTMVFVSEEDWVGINCETCHILDENGIVQEKLVWLNPLTMEYEKVSNSNELCTKCHLTTKGVSATGGRGVAHEIYLGGSAHKNWAGLLDTKHRPDQCTDCHDPHTQQPKLCEDCHENPLEMHADVRGFEVMYEKVTCMACHDATGLDVGPLPDNEEFGDMFVTQETSMGRRGPKTEFVLSHSPQWQVLCDRCHYQDNPWELTVLTEDGEIPEESEGDGG